MNEQPYNRYALSVQRPHLVLLGAGASKAAFPNGEKNGLKLPLMNNFVETIQRLTEYLDKCGIDYKGQNFENLYSSLYDNSKYDEIRQNIEVIIFEYFADMQPPEEPTLYDHLVLSLTGRDIIATFNWDPFLWQAICRNYQRVGGMDNLPKPLFLHGNTAIGICTEHRPIGISNRYANCPRCRKSLKKCKLLYPIKQKEYNRDVFISKAWELIRKYLNSAFMFTIFGYGAPSSDVEAVNLLKEGWGDKNQRVMEEIEVIDIMDEDALCKRWDDFIYSHHYNTHNDFYSCLIAKCSRRSADVFFNAACNCIAWEEHPIPQNASWEELDEWLKPYLEIENKARQSAS